MTRVFRITISEHLQNDKEDAEKVDSWRTLVKVVAVEDGYVEEAIIKLRGTTTPEEALVVERRILNVELVAEAM